MRGLSRPVRWSVRLAVEAKRGEAEPASAVRHQAVDNRRLAGVLDQSDDGQPPKPLVSRARRGPPRRPAACPPWASKSDDGAIRHGRHARSLADERVASAAPSWRRISLEIAEDGVAREVGGLGDLLRRALDEEGAASSRPSRPRAVVARHRRRRSAHLRRTQRSCPPRPADVVGEISWSPRKPRRPSAPRRWRR
jgi:hypothetical protein